MGQRQWPGGVKAIAFVASMKYQACICLSCFNCIDLVNEVCTCFLCQKSQQDSPNNNAASQSPTNEQSVVKEEDEEEVLDALRRAALKSTKEIRLEVIIIYPVP